MTRSDEDIRSEIAAELRWDPMLNAESVVVWLMNGAVALTGFVAERDDVWRASLIAARVAGVRSVTNHLEVSPAGGTPPCAVVEDEREPSRAVLLPLPRPSRWEIEEWLETSARHGDAADTPPPPPPG
jgi:hypothetical protein